MGKIIVSVAKDFSKTPGSRYKKEGKFSGEEFRQNILDEKFKQALDKGKKIVINLDGTFGYGTSFLEEAFGGLARKYRKSNILEYMEFISEEEPYLIDDIKKYITDVIERK